MTDYRALDRLLLPDENTWGQGIRPYTAAELNEIAQNVNESKQLGYGARLHADTGGYTPGQPGGRRAAVPSGFDAADHPNRAGLVPGAADPDIITEFGEPVQQVDPRLRELFIARGWVQDQHGRPLHPRHEQLLSDDRIGMVTGLGFGWWYGEAVVADAVVTTGTGHVLVVDRDTDAGRIPSLPGGYTTPSDFGRTVAQWQTGDRPVTAEGIVTGALRRTAAETGLVVPRWATPELVRGIRPVSSVHTLHAWTMTVTVRVHLPGTELPALERATSARWVPDYATVLDRMWPDHRRALLAAVE
ncbi:NUDIX hydrolase [Saccharopolyspora taberi]